MINRAIVKNGKPYPPSSIDELQILPGVPEAVALLRKAGFSLFVITNQPDVARQKTPMKTVENINAELDRVLRFDAILVCFHDDADKCTCRKPKPGFMLRMRDERNIDLSGSFVVGDRWRDIEAGDAAGCRTIFIDHNYNEPLPPRPDFTCASLLEAARWITAPSPRSDT